MKQSTCQPHRLAKPAHKCASVVKLVYRRVVFEEVLAGTEISGGDDDDELMLNVLRCQLTY